MRIPPFEIPTVPKGYIQTFTGRHINPIRPEPTAIHILDIAHALSMLCRWTGHVKAFYSIAQHSVLVSNLAEFLARERGLNQSQAALCALMHDGSEAYIADVAHPVKHHPEMHGYRDIEYRLEAAVIAAFELPGDPALWALVKECDGILQVTEARDLLPNRLAFEWPYAPMPMPIDRTWTPAEAEERFLERFHNVHSDAHYGLAAKLVAVS